jgi:hypothetical protein
VFPIRPLDFLSFDPEGLPAGYLRFLRAATTLAGLVFSAIAIYAYVMANRTLNTHATDIMAMLLIFKFFFFFAVGGVSAGMALSLAIISYRCWRASS